MSMDSSEKLIVGATATLTVGSFMLSSVATQDAQLSGESPGFNPETQRPMILTGWLVTGVTGVLAGMWAKNRGLMALGAALALGGAIWTLVVPHPAFNRDRARAINGKPVEQLQSGQVVRAY